MVFKRLTRSILTKEKPRIPAGERVYAIGDVHGRIDILDDLLQQVRADDAQRGPASTSLIFLGDLVDRGPSSRGVIDRLISLRENNSWRLHFLLGNHDEVFLKALSGDSRALRFLIRIGGRQTILSYGITEDEFRAADFDTLSHLLASHVPDAHVAFLKSFEDYCEIGDYLFVHAGVKPNVAFADQKPSDLRWIREEFLSSRARHPKMVVHGHSISNEAEVRPNRIGIDTGAFASGRLTALGLEGSEMWFLAAVGEPDQGWGALTH